MPLFQEQVIQIAMVAAGFTAGEAGQVRRSMAAWRRKGGLEQCHDKLVASMLAATSAVKTPLIPCSRAQPKLSLKPSEQELPAAAA